ncbi:MAG: AhpC/TSA family protein [Beijerinckiaceae bacterium]|nr:AhpC/TSA family protein [Beijerinckiaceae bacterium]
MKELTLSQILEEAFETARDLDAPLSARLETFADSVRLASPAFAEAVDRLITRLNLSGSGASAPAVGDPMPPFMLPDDQGHLVSLQELLAKGPVALSFHRGHWCPYCRLNTNALAQAQCEVEPIGGQIIAITPDLQHFATALKSDASAKPFPILTDVDNGYALSLNLAIFVGLEMQKFMTSVGWDIAPYLGNDAWILPIPATFVVGRDSLIRARFVDPDYRKRMAIDVIVDALRAC